jgi:hypothetical protein
MKDLTQSQCLKFQKCNAPICPIDPIWQKRQHMNGDRVCFYLMEAQKPNAKALFEVRSLGYLYEVMVRHAPAIADTYRPIKKAIEKAMATSSRMTRKIGERHER